MGVVPASGRGKVALAGSHEGAQTVGSGRFSVPSNDKAGWRIVTSVVVSSAGEDVLDSLEAGIEYLTDALGDLRVGLSLTELRPFRVLSPLQFLRPSNRQKSLDDE